MTGTLQVEGLSNIVLGSEVRAICAAYGNVLAVSIIPDPVTGLGSGTAVVEMETENDAINAQAALNGSLSYGRVLTVTASEPAASMAASQLGDLGESAGRSGRGNPTGFGRSRA